MRTWETFPAAEMDRLINADDAARLIGCHPDTLRKMWQTGVIVPPLRIGRHVRWRVRDVVNWIDAEAAKRDGGL